MNRRGFLASAATAGAVALAGCAGPGARLEMAAVTDADLAERASTSVATAPGSVRSVVAAAVENGSATAAESETSFDPDRPVAFDGGYYRLTRTVVDEREERSWSIEVEYDPPVDAEGPTIAFGDLPAVDRRVLSSLIPPPEDHRGRMGVGTVYGRDGERASVLVPTQQYEFVTYQGARYRLRVEGPQTITVETYRYDAERLANGTAGFAGWVRERYLFTLDALSSAESEIVESAVDGGYHAQEASDAFASLETRFRRHPGFGVDEYGGEWVVAYGGGMYWTALYSQSE